MGTTTTPRTTTTDTPATDDGLVVDPAVELMSTRAQRAAAVRATHDYDGRLTLAMISALQPLLEEPTPTRYVTTTAATTDKPYISTGLNSTQYQVDYLNAVFGLAHWRYLLHYEESGTLARCWAVVGNDLTAIRVNPDTGELDIPETAEVLVVRDGWGGHRAGSTKGDVLKGSETNAMKRTLARLGPGGDVYRLDVEADLHGQDRPFAPNAPSGEVPSAGAGDRKATVPQVKMLRAKARDKGLTASQLANIMRAAAGLAAFPWPSEGQAQAVLDDKLPKLPRQFVDPMVQMIDTGAPPPPAPAPANAPAPVTDAPPPIPELPAAATETTGTVVPFDPAALAAKAG